MLLPFPEWHVVGIVQSAARSDWLFSLRHTHSCSPHVFLLLNTAPPWNAVGTCGLFIYHLPKDISVAANDDYEES